MSGFVYPWDSRKDGSTVKRFIALLVAFAKSGSSKGAATGTTTSEKKTEEKKP
jgi:hypothetical protein